MALTPPQLIANRQSMQIYGGGDTNIEKAQSKEKQNKKGKVAMSAYVKRAPPLTDKTRAWLQIRKSVAAINNVGENPIEVRLFTEYKTRHCIGVTDFNLLRCSPGPRENR